MLLVALVVIPGVLVVAAMIAAIVSVRASSLRITVAGVEIRNYPQAPRTVPLDDVVRFEPTPPVGNFASIRPRTGVLVVRDGSRLPVRSLSAPGAGAGVDALNARIDALRGTAPP